MTCQHPDEQVCTCHRTRVTYTPEPVAYDGNGTPLYAWQLEPTAPLVAAIEAVYDALEDRS